MEDDPTIQMRADANEAHVRFLRDVVFEKPTSDKNWNGCREAWLQPEATQWLENQYERILR